mmetsp:Transcript_11882/g.32692  ORF Transcript_11882/g.32692 Transcript_11882/m.32692 type:complete len:230 (-) Transcript_11882:443-1132(-)
MLLQGDGSELLRWLRRQHILDGVVLANAAQLGSILELLAAERIGHPLQTINDGIEQPQRCEEEVGLLAHGLKQHLTLRLHGQRFIGTAEVQNGVLARLVGDAIDEVGGEIGLGDGVATCHLAVAEHDKWGTLLHNFELSRHGFEERGGSHDAVRHLVLRFEIGLEFELGLLELQPWILDAECAEQDEVTCVVGHAGVEAVLGGLVIDGVRILLDAGSRGEAGDDRFDLA